MADTKCTVTFDGVNDSSWNFNPQDLPIKPNGTITLVAAANSTWTFQKANDLPAGLNQNVEGNGKRLVITDINVAITNNISFSVTVLLDINGATRTSPMASTHQDGGVPPIIVNDGSQGGKKRE